MTERLEMEEKHISLYLCDPIKNKNCPGNGKPWCGELCFCTTNPEVALSGTVALTEEQYRDEEKRRKLNDNC